MDARIVRVERDALLEVGDATRGLHVMEQPARATEEVADAVVGSDLEQPAREVDGRGIVEEPPAREGRTSEGHDVAG